MLNLRSNRVVSLEPGSLDRLSNLEELVLTKNRLSSIPKGLFAHMRGLRVLELNRNRFIEIVGLTFHGLENLRVLRLRRNQGCNSIEILGASPTPALIIFRSFPRHVQTSRSLVHTEVVAKLVPKSVSKPHLKILNVY